MDKYLSKRNNHNTMFYVSTKYNVIYIMSTHNYPRGDSISFLWLLVKPYYVQKNFLKIAPMYFSSYVI